MKYLIIIVLTIYFSLIIVGSTLYKDRKETSEVEVVSINEDDDMSKLATETSLFILETDIKANTPLNPLCLQKKLSGQKFVLCYLRDMKGSWRGNALFIYEDGVFYSVNGRARSIFYSKKPWYDKEIKFDISKVFAEFIPMLIGKVDMGTSKKEAKTTKIAPGAIDSNTTEANLTVSDSNATVLEANLTLKATQDEINASKSSIDDNTAVLEINATVSDTNMSTTDLNTSHRDNNDT